jgi:Kdo2-lipid IVA lauroyltransferase/acyltransferase
MDFLAKIKTHIFPLKGFVIVTLLKLIYWLPDRLTDFLAAQLGLLAYYLSQKRRRIILTNLKIAFPAMTLNERESLAKKSSVASGKLLPEFAKAWLGSQAEIEQQITAVNQQQLIDTLSSDNQPVIIVTPHIGNWEFLVQWVQINYPMFGLYSASPIPQLDQMIYRARSQFGCQPFAADNRGVLNLLRKLKAGGLMVILPDQVPQKGAGVHVPFFGQSAYTMTLLHKMVQKTGAKLLFAYCIRNTADRGFTITVEPAKFNYQEKQVEEFNIGLNQQIESIIRLHPEQYVWDYKRFKAQLDGTKFYTK